METKIWFQHLHSCIASTNILAAIYALDSSSPEIHIFTDSSAAIKALSSTKPTKK